MVSNVSELVSGSSRVVLGIADGFRRFSGVLRKIHVGFQKHFTRIQLG